VDTGLIFSRAPSYKPIIGETIKAKIKSFEKLNEID